MTWLQRSLVVAARWFASLSFKGFRHSAWLGWISPSGRSLLPGAPALTRTGLAPARTTRLSGRTMSLLHAESHATEIPASGYIFLARRDVFCGAWDPSPDFS